jgi:hypothetical protein
LSLVVDQDSAALVAQHFGQPLSELFEKALERTLGADLRRELDRVNHSLLFPIDFLFNSDFFLHYSNVLADKSQYLFIL